MLNRPNLSILYDDLIVHKDYASESGMTDLRIFRVFNQVQSDLARVVYRADPDRYGTYVEYSAATSGTLPPLVRKIQYVEHQGSGGDWTRVDQAKFRRLRDGISESGNAPSSGTFRVNYARMLPFLSYGTADSATATTIVLAETPTYGETVLVDDYYNGATIEIVSATTGANQTGTITDYVASTRTATVAWSTTPTGTIIYNIVCELPNDFVYNGMILGALAQLTSNQEIEYKYRELKQELQNTAKRVEQANAGFDKVEIYNQRGYAWYLRGNTIHFYQY